MSLVLIPTLHAEHLTRHLSLPRGCTLVYPKGNKDGKRTFPDGEVYMELPSISPQERVMILHSGMPDPNQGIVELEMLLSILTDLGIRDIGIFFTYFPYGMQDHPKEKGEPRAAEHLIEKLTRYYSVTYLWVIDAHFSAQPWIKKYPLKNISAVPLLKEAALRDYPNAVFIAPDQGAQYRTQLPGTTKSRKNSFEVDILADDAFTKKAQGQTIAAVDDLVETGGTALKFAEICREAGAKDVIALLTHGVLATGIQRLRQAYATVYLTNSINHPESNIDITPLIQKELLSFAQDPLPEEETRT